MQIKTPGVYIEERNAFPNSIVVDETAVPAFIGYTQQAVREDRSVSNELIKVSSMQEFEFIFGGAADSTYNINELDDGFIGDPDFSFEDKAYSLDLTSVGYLLHQSMQWFFINGGTTCYVISVGDYESAPSSDSLLKGLNLVEECPSVTLIVMPETTLLSKSQSAEVQQAILKVCNDGIHHRFAILDIWGGNQPQDHPSTDCIGDFREGIGSDNLAHGAAYYPWLNTSLLSASQLPVSSIANLARLQVLLRQEFKIPKVIDETTEENLVKLADKINQFGGSDEATQLLFNISPLIKSVMRAITDKINVLPPSAAMAGVYSNTDSSRGVWAAPANVAVVSVTSPTVEISHDEQEGLNVSIDGKSVNAIRSFTGVGVLVWGARTLDGNSLDWRYISVRRTINSIEKSIRMGIESFAFAPNDASTWTSVKAIIENYLTDMWRLGGLQGAAAEDAFHVNVGLGSTMTSTDILDGRMKVSVRVALVRPADFIGITFEQAMSTS